MDISKFFNDSYIFSSICLSNVDNPYDKDVLKQILDCTKNDTIIIEKRYFNNKKYAFVKNTDGLYFCRKRGKLFFNPHGCENNRVSLYDILESQLNSVYMPKCIDTDDFSDSVLSIRDTWINYENTIYRFIALGLSGQVRITRLTDDKTIEIYRGYDDVTIEEFMTKAVGRL